MPWVPADTTHRSLAEATPLSKKWRERRQALRFMLQPRRRKVFAHLIDPEELAKYGIDADKSRPGTSTDKTEWPRYFESLDRTPLIFERSVASLERQVKAIGRQLARHKPWEEPAPGAAPIDLAHRLELLRTQAGAEARIVAKGRAASGRKDEKEAEARIHASQQRARKDELSLIKDRKRRLAAAAASTPTHRELVASVDFDSAESLLSEKRHETTIILPPSENPDTSPRHAKTVVMRRSSKEPTKIIRKGGRPSGEPTVTRSKTVLPKTWPAEVRALAAVGARNEAEAKFREAVARAGETAEKMKQLARTPLAASQETPKAAPQGVKRVKSPATFISGIMAHLTKLGKPVPDSLRKLHQHATNLERTPLVGRS